jgi:hypothetical protein
VWAAYEGSLAPIHTYMLRTAVWAGLYALPSKDHFMRCIGETHASASVHAAEFIAGAGVVVGEIELLFDGHVIPGSDVTFIPQVSAPAAEKN